MKKTLAILLSITLVITSAVIFAACSKQEANNDTPSKGDVVGGWTRADSPEITDDITKLLEKATKNLTGADYTPVAYVASQVVAGTNHCVLCKVAPVVPNASAKYALVYIYEDLEGNAEITKVLDTEVSADYPENDGGWAAAQSPVMPEDATEALAKATETLTGAEYTPVALLATQVVGGMNYRILCEAKASVPNGEIYYVIVTVYSDLDGNAEITETAEITDTVDAE